MNFKRLKVGMGLIFMSLLFIVNVAECKDLSKEQSKTKKIKILATNNGIYAYKDSSFVFDKILDKQYLNSLRNYIEKRGFYPEKKELQLIKKALKWSTTQFKHDGANTPLKGSTALDILKNAHTKNKRYRCVEYAQVLNELLQSYGFVTRSVSLRTKEAAYGGIGHGHVAMEVWSNDLKKWLFLDPQFGAFVTYKGSILNLYEIYNLKNKKKWRQLKVESKYLNTTKKKEEYKKFLKRYFGFMRTGKVSLLLEMRNPVLTFQRLPDKNIRVHTDNPEELYPQINRVTIELNFNKSKVNKSKDLYKETKKIKTEKDFLEYTYKFPAIPDFKVLLKNNMPSFSFYEYRLLKKGDWIRVKKDTLNWMAIKENNYLEVRAVNKFNRPGPVTFINLLYK